ncbi:lumican-like [Conger conger]|uniref:lumican-like n=1 Tax=Conger conger TaxID=82655 RepID=UPI002A5AA1C2|nr:lumican-like [Conger conger]
MSPLFVPLLAVLIGQVSPSHYDYDYYQGPSMMLGPPGPNCPEECECPVLFPSAMYCNKRNLKSVPVVPNGIKYLYLQDNNLKEIKASAFVNATDLRWLILDNNQLTNGAVEKGIFEKLGSLEKLHVNFNNLTEPLGPLAKTMNELKITWNKLSKFPSGTLSGLENLTMIDLHGNELTSDGIAGAFKGLKSLVYLDVSKNKLGKLPMGLPSSIEMLYADYNEIGSVPKEFANKLPQLQYLRIAHNKLADAGIPPGAFNVSTLIELDLSYNKLQTIPEVNENLENLYLQVNKISKFDVGSFCKYMTAINFSKLRHLRLDGNNLTRSSVPDEAANCLRLATDVMVEPTD